MKRILSKFLHFMAVLAVIFTVACGMNKTTEQKKPPNLQELNMKQPAPTPLLSSPAPSPAASNSDNVTIGSYATILLDKDPDRVNNIEIAIDEINGYTLQPGEIFSFNAIVGRRKAEKGYEKAKIIVNGKSKKALGGGICQLSSTLYNAAAIAGLEILERHSHSKEVGYVPRGQDAAVNFGTEDFKFRNSKGYPITVYAELTGGMVYASIQALQK